MEKNKIDATVTSLFQGMENVISSKTVVGEPIHVGDTIILPLIDISFGLGAGAMSEQNKDKAAGGLGGKMIPSAVLVIQNGKTRLVNIKNQDTVTKILDMLPEVADRFAHRKEKKVTEQDVADMLDQTE